MFKVTITKEGLEEPVLELETEDRKLAYAWAKCCDATPLTCKVIVEQAPKEVKFKGVGKEG